MVNAAFAFHKDTRIHSGAIMSLGGGDTYTGSTHQKLNTKRSTESELVGADDFKPQVLRTCYFLEARGYDVRENFVYQYNHSSIILEKNGKGSSSERTRPINIRYFFITDRIASGDLDVEYCPTGEMLAEFFTEPLRGSPFRKFRNDIINIRVTTQSEVERKRERRVDA